MKVVTIYYMICNNFSEFMLKGVNENRCQSSAFYLTASLVRGVYLLVNYQKSIFHPILAVHIRLYIHRKCVTVD